MADAAEIFRDALHFIRQACYGLVRDNSSRIGGRLRRWSIGTPCQIDTAVLITHPNNFHAQQGSALRHGCHIGNTHGHVTLGTKSHLGAYCHVNAIHGEVRIGADVAIGPGTKIVSYSNNYTPGKNISDSKITRDIVIGDHVFIGANVTILPGTIIDPHVVVGAGSVVKERLESFGLYAGAPCRRIRDLPAYKPGEADKG